MGYARFSKIFGEDRSIDFSRLNSPEPDFLGNSSHRRNYFRASAVAQGQQQRKSAVVSGGLLGLHQIFLTHFGQVTDVTNCHLPKVCQKNLMRSEEHTSELQSHSDLVCR